MAYWHVHDLGGETPANALAEIDRHVEKLIMNLDHLVSDGKQCQPGFG